MASLPVYLPASAAALEGARGPVDMIRYKVPDQLSVYGVQIVVAGSTARKRVPVLQCWVRSAELAQLFIEMVARDKEAVTGERTGGEAGVPGQDGPLLLKCMAEYLVVIGRWIVQDIES